MSQCRYLEGENIAPATAAEARKLINRYVEYLCLWDVDDRETPARIYPRRGAIADAYRRELEIAGDWIAFSHIVEMRLLA